MPRTTEPVIAAPKPSAIVSSAAFMRSTRSGNLRRGRLPKETSQWQNECWMYRDTVGELRYAVSWFSNALSRAVLRPARRDSEGVLRTIEVGEEVDTLEAILGVNQSQMIKAMGEHFFIAGEWYLVGQGLGTDEEEWIVLSPEELTKNGDRYYVDYGGGQREEIDSDAAVIRVHNPHPRRKSYADSPVRAVLGNLNEIAMLSAHVNAQTRSRLAGAGILLIANEMSFSSYNPDNESASATQGNDPFMQTLGTAMAAAIQDQNDPSALVPIVLRVPGEHLDKIKHLTFWSEIDEKAATLRDGAIRRLALGIDLPPEVLLGTADVNHWGAWQIEESTIKAHIEPALEVISAAMTVVLRDALDDDSVIVVYDTSALRLRPNRSKEALELFDRGQIKGSALLRETGFSPEDEPDEEERKDWLLRKVASGSATPGQVEAALRLLGVEITTEESRTEGETRESRPDPSLQEHPERAIPEDARAAALQTACEALVFRALERVGNRIRNSTRSLPPGVDVVDLYRHVPPRGDQIDRLTEGAWTPLPSLLHFTGYDAETVRASLDSYVRGLLTTSASHDTDRMMRTVETGLTHTRELERV